MEEYRKKLKRQKIMLMLLIIVALIFVIIQRLYPDSYDGLGPEHLRDFQLGLLCAVQIIAVLRLINIRKAESDSRRLQIMYNAEYDERKRLIKSKAGLPVLLFTSMLMIFAGIIAGYFNFIVFCTLIAAAFSQMLIAIVLKLYYMKKL